MPPPDPLEDVAFLARSAHRVGVLKTLADGPLTRPDLHEEIGISQPTLGRILEPFRDRNWVERRGQEYALDPAQKPEVFFQLSENDFTNIGAHTGKF